MQKLRKLHELTLDMLKFNHNESKVGYPLFDIMCTGCECREDLQTFMNTP
jgi:hypothetical protein